MAIPAIGKIQPQSDLVTLKIEKKLRRTRLLLALMPAWQTDFPPYGLARLTGVMREAGYSVIQKDFNLELIKKAQNLNIIPNWNVNDYRIFKEDFEEKTEPLIRPILQDQLEQILQAQPDVVGFSLYWSNEKATYWMCREIKKRSPQTIIVLGGPSTHSPGFQAPDTVDYWISADGEPPLLELLDALDRGERPTEKHLKPQYKLDINFLPLPDYDDFPLSQYNQPGLFPAELSRGCVAKCTFCASTHHWKYRYRSGLSTIQEIKYLNQKYGARQINFVDHLVNGNLTELQSFVEEMAKIDFDMGWSGFARCNGKMTTEFIEKLSRGRCGGLSMGIESGSQKVLNAIRKNVLVQEIDRNITDCYKFNIHVCALFIVGFPTEDTEAFADTLALILRQHQHVKFLIFAPRCDPDVGSVFQRNPELFNVTRTLDVMGDWHTNDFRNTALNRIIRSKTLQILLLELQNTGSPFTLFAKREWVKEDYSIKYFGGKTFEPIETEVASCQLIDTAQNDFILGLLNEPGALFRSIWRSRGAFEIQFKVTERDCNDFGIGGFIPFKADFHFKIDEKGFWTYSVQQKLDLNLADHPVVKRDFSYEIDVTKKGYWASSEKQRVLTVGVYEETRI